MTDRRALVEGHRGLDVALLERLELSLEDRKLALAAREPFVCRRFMLGEPGEVALNVQECPQGLDRRADRLDGSGVGRLDSSLDRLTVRCTAAWRSHVRDDLVHRASATCFGRRPERAVWLQPRLEGP